MYEILGYPSDWTVEPGQKVDFHISCDGVDSFDVDLVQVRSGDSSPNAPGLKERVVIENAVKGVKGQKQDCAVGSFVRVEPYPENALAARSWILGIMPTLPEKGEKQIIFGRWDERNGIGYRLGIDETGHVFWEQRDGRDQTTLTLERAVVPRQWYLVCIRIEAGYIRLSQSPIAPSHAMNSFSEVEGQAPVLDDHAVGGLPLLIGASADWTGGKLSVHQAYNGRVDSLTMLPYLAEDGAERELTRPSSERAFKRPPVMSWDFSVGIDTDLVFDTAQPMRTGTINNLPTRAVPGLRWNPNCMDWQAKPDYFAALHFHDDDLEDAGWEKSFTLAIPDDLPSGIYAARLRSTSAVEHVTFFVRPKRGGPRKKIAFLASTATYLAYSNSHYRFDEAGMEMKSGNFMVVYPWETYLNDHRELGLSMYDTHSDGYGVYYSSRKRPVFSMHLQCRAWSLNGDTHLTDWMEEKGFEFDVITDDMLHQDGLEALEGYNVVLTGAHPEYWTTRMWDAMTAYQQNGGRLMYMGGNGFYWRCAYHPTKPWLMELRRTETGARYYETPAGESYHSYTGEYGGTWRRIGKAPNTLVGIGTVATGFDASSYYRRREESRDPRAAFIFDGVDDEIIGDFGCTGGAAGDEIDRANHELGTPPHALIVARSEKHTRYYNVVPEETTYHHPTQNGQEAEKCYADLLFYECLNGGAVFSTGSITWCCSLEWNGYQNNVSKITENVLRRFASDEPFQFPAGDQ